MSYQRLFEKLSSLIPAIRFMPLVIIASLSFAGEALAAPPETMPILRAQVFFETFNTPDAGSDDSVRVELNPYNGTWVDSGFDDWEIGSRTYDLRLDGISRLSDISQFRVSKTGSGGWCIGKIRLIINGATIYDEVFPSGHWLDNSGGHSTVYYVDGTLLRQRAEWTNYVVPPPTNIVPVGDMRSRIQCLFGDYLTAADNLGFRNSHPITVSTLDVNTWRVNVDLDDDKPWPIPDPDVDVDFDLTIVWTGFIWVRPNLIVENLHVGYTWPAYGESARSFMNYDFVPRINEMMKGYSYRVGTGIRLAPNGDLNFLPIVINPVPIDFVTALADSDGAEVSETPTADKAREPLGLWVKTGGDIEPFEERIIDAEVRSGLKEDSDVDVSFSLPPGILFLAPAVEASSSTGTRWLTPEIALQNDGATLITLSDRLDAGQRTSYQLRLMFMPMVEKRAHIVTRVIPAGGNSAAGIDQVDAVTSFRFNGKVVTPEGTTVSLRPRLFDK